MTDIYSWFEFEDKSAEPEKLKAGMSRILSEPMLTPTHASYDERRKPRWDPEIMEIIPPCQVSIQVWRKGGRDDVSYKGSVAFQSGDFQVSDLDFQGVSESQERELYEATERIAAKNELILGYLLPYRDPDPDVQDEVDIGRGVHIVTVREFGWFGVFPRMWFGRRSWPTIEKVASKFPGARIKELASGSIQYDIVERPWELTDQEYLEIRAAFQRELEAAGIGADYSNTTFPKRARLWKEPFDWVYR